jgi:DNA-binding MarR family transcriptional regulator
VPGAYDEVSRRAILRWVSGAFILDWPGSTKVKVQAPRLLASGTLALAQGTGDVLWGDARFDGAPTDPAPTGSFFVASPDASRLSVQGTTQNRPVAPGAAVTGRAALLAAGAIAGIGAILLLAFGLYARLNPKDVGKHPARAAILEFLERSPGARLTEIQQQAHLPRSTALHHLRALEQAGLVMHRRVGKFLIYGRSHHHGTLNDPSFLAQRVRRHELILQILQEQPGLRQQEIAARMGVTQSYVSRILARLERDGLVGRDERDRRSFRVRASAPGSGSTGA